ncbi:hypothetical protein DL98DRAFT_416096 [Cadophora sp. DSE1049]|nr:hypothetical protein DL98DRAFT_416096 [Cadophora sp. DSE1049]
MNSSRHANRSGRGQGQTSSQGRGRGRGARSRGGFNDRSSFSSGPSSVPTIQQVIPGSSVSIVLKIDQPTGRQVQGTVAELLTRGNHPRGIKVRLQDGRVGRVQRMASAEEVRVGSEGLSGLGRNGEGAEGAGEENRRGKNAQKETDQGAAEDEQADVVTNGSSSQSSTTLCPVCGEFEGDEVALAHHVNGHFG